MEVNKIYPGDCLEGMRSIPNNSVHCCVTSPPYYGLRDYRCDGQIGLENTPDAYIDRLVEVFREVKRVLRDDGTLWVNIGDSYAGSGKGAWANKNIQKEVYVPDADSPECLMSKTWPYIKPKDLIGIPWMLAFALRANGWYLRQDIIWSKPNPMPESVTDRCTKAHEYIFLFSKSSRYYFDADAIKQPARESSIARISQNIDNQRGSDRVQGKTNGRMKAVIGGKKRRVANETLNPSDPMYRHNTYREYEYTDKANKRSVWEVSTKPFKEAHFATFPQDLIVPCILAGCQDRGIVLDPFMGSGTTAIVAKKLNRNYIGIELNPEYVKIAEKRLRNEIGLFQ